MNLRDLEMHIDALTLERVKEALADGKGAQRVFVSKASKYAAIWQKRIVCPPGFKRTVLIRWQEDSTGMLTRPEFEVTYL